MNPRTQTPNQQAILRRINARLDREIEEGLFEAEGMLRQLLETLLGRAHRELVAGRIGLPRYYRDVETIACCAERLNDEGE